MNKFAKFICQYVLVGFILFCSVSYAIPVIEITEDGTKSRRAYNIHSSWQWIKNSKGAQEARLAVGLGFDKKIAKASRVDLPIRVDKSRLNILFLMGATTEKIELDFEDGSHHILDIHFRFSEMEVLQNGCVDLNLTVDTPQKVANPFYLGVSCHKEGDYIGITLSVPNDVEWGESNYFEKAGKGEAWRYFLIPERLSPMQKPTELDFMLGSGEQVNFFRIREKVPFEKIKKDRKKTFPTLGLGFSNLNLKSDFANPSAVEPDIYASLDAPLGFSRVGATLEYAAPLLAGAQKMGFYGATFYGGVPWETGHIQVTPRVLFRTLGLDYSPPGISYALRYTQMGIGVNLAYFLNDNGAQWILNVSEEGHLFKGNGTDLLLSAGYDFGTLSDRQLGVLFRYETQTYSGPVNGRTLSQLSLNLVLHFW